MGIEPTYSTAKKAEKIGIKCEKIFLTKKSSSQLLKKYKKVWEEMDMMDDYDAAKVEMAHDFEKELKELKQIFKSGE